MDRKDTISTIIANARFAGIILDMLKSIRNKKNHGKFVPGQGEPYFYVKDNGVVLKAFNAGTFLDQDRIRIGNCYAVVETAQRAAKKIIGIFKNDSL